MEDAVDPTVVFAVVVVIAIIAASCCCVSSAAAGAWATAKTGVPRAPDRCVTLGGVPHSEIPEFLSPSECDALRDAALRKGLERSKTVGSDGPTRNRTSSHVFLDAEDDPFVDELYSRLSRATGYDRGTFEGVQVLRYLPSQRYDEHYDPCFGCLENGRDLLRRATVLMYLNDDFDGGETNFPLARVTVRPLRGKACMFESMRDGKIVRESKHRSLPVRRGVKWLATVWISISPLQPMWGFS